MVPADCRIVAFDGTLYTDQAGLTGESDPVKKNLGDMCYVTTGVLRGDAFLMVVDTGRQTFVGRTMSLVQGKKDNRRPRHVKEHDAVLQAIGTSMLAVAATPILLRGLFVESAESSLQILQLAASLAIVAANFVGSSTVSSYRAIGASRLLEDGGIVQALTGIESLAGIEILCSDKTGTITENRLTLLEPYCVSYDAEDLILTACLSSSPDKKDLDSIDRAIAMALKQYPQAKANLDRYKVLDWQPVDVKTKRMQCLVESPLGERLLCVKGAPRAILELCLQDQPDKVTIEEKFKNAVADFANRGLRTLGIARKRENGIWELLGAAPLFDPPRFDTISALKVAKELGVSVKIFTGDAAAIAKSTVQSIGIGSNIFDANSIGDGGQTPPPELIERIEMADGYAEVFGVRKERIVGTLQKCGHLVAATGDGENDVPTIRRADCGIAVHGATERAQDASDIVFQKRPGLWPMVRAIQTSRQIFQQVHNFIAQQMILTLHIFLVMLWYFAVYGEVLNLRMLIFGTHASGLARLFFSSSSADIPFSKVPIRWSSRRLLTEVIPLAMTTTAGSCLGVSAISSQGASTLTHKMLGDSQRILATRSQVLSLSIVLSGHWMPLLMHTDGRFWAYKQNMKALCGLLFVDFLVTLLCITGWTSQENQLRVILAIWIWFVSVGTFGVAAAVRRATFDGQLLKRQLTTINT